MRCVRLVCRITTDRYTTAALKLPSILTVADVDVCLDVTVLVVAVAATMPSTLPTGDAGRTDEINVEETSFLSGMTETVGVAQKVVGEVPKLNNVCVRPYTCKQRWLKADFTGKTSEREVPFRPFLGLSSIPHCDCRFQSVSA